MNDWRKPCEHGQYDAHLVVIPCVREYELGRQHEHGFGCLTTEYCPGGSPVTADLEALGEKIRVCEVHNESRACIDGGHCEASHTSERYSAPVRCQLVVRLLIIPDEQEVGV